MQRTSAQSTALIKALFRTEVRSVKCTDEPDVHLAKVNVATATDPIAGITTKVELKKVYADDEKLKFHYERADLCRGGRDSSLQDIIAAQKDMHAFACCAAIVLLRTHGVIVEEEVILQVIEEIVDELLLDGVEVEEVEIPPQAAEWMQNHTGNGDNVGGDKTVS